MDDAYRLVARAAQKHCTGPFQIEAAIQAAHCYRAHSGKIPWVEIAALYDRLMEHYPTVGAAVGSAVASAYAHGDPGRGVQMLTAMPPDRVRTYQPYWVARGHLHELLGQRDEARGCLARALDLTAQPRVVRFLEAWRARIT